MYIPYIEKHTVRPIPLTARIQREINRLANALEKSADIIFDESGNDEWKVMDALNEIDNVRHRLEHLREVLSDCEITKRFNSFNV